MKTTIAALALAASAMTVGLPESLETTRGSGYALLDRAVCGSNLADPHDPVTCRGSDIDRSRDHIGVFQESGSKWVALSSTGATGPTLDASRYGNRVVLSNDAGTILLDLDAMVWSRAGIYKGRAIYGKGVIVVAQRDEFTAKAEQCPTVKEELEACAASQALSPF